MRRWQSERTDIPETWFNAAVYLDKVKMYMRQISVNYSHLDSHQILSDAHRQVNAAMLEGEYVSNYRGD